MARTRRSSATPAKPESRDIVSPHERYLTAPEFQALAQVPPEAEWFANITNPRTRRAYRIDITDFARFIGISRPEEFRIVTRAHVIRWRKELEQRRLSSATIRRKLSAVSSLFDGLCEANAITHNPVKGVERPKEGANVGKTPAIGSEYARLLLDAPPDDSVKGLRDRAILATLLFHAVRRQELCDLEVKDFAMREGVMHFTVHGKGGKIRYLPVHARAIRLISVR